MAESQEGTMEIETGEETEETVLLVKISEDYINLQNKFIEMERKYQMQIDELSKSNNSNNPFGERLLALVSDLFGQDLFSDMKILLSGERQIPGHKFVLLARTDDWGEDIVSTEKLDLTDIKVEVALDFVRWIYRDDLDITISENHLTELLHLATKYKLPILYNRCLESLSANNQTADTTDENFDINISDVGNNVTVEDIPGIERSQNQMIIQPDSSPNTLPNVDIFNPDHIVKSENNTGVTIIKQEPDSDDNDIQDQQGGNENQNDKVSKDSIKVEPIVDFEMALALMRHAHQFVCTTCGKTFRKKSQLKQHSVVHIETKGFPCEECGKLFNKEENLQSHLKIHTGLKNHICDFCHNSFYHKSSLRKHIRKDHKNEEQFMCNICTDIFASDEQLQEHIDAHSKEVFMCYVCGLEFKDKKTKKAHEMCHNVKSFDCNICEKSFKALSHLRSHMTAHNNIAENHCRICRQSFRSHAALMSHCQTHKGNPKYECKVCHKLQPNMRSLEHHMKEHDGATLYDCKYCEKGFNNRNSLADHIKGHEGIKPFKCDFCGLEFIRRMSLVRHRNLHTKEKYFHCSHAGCTKKYLDRTGLVKHLLVHKGVKKFICDTCGKGFYVSEELRRHQVVHSDSRPFPCPSCSQAFKTKIALNRHIKTHYDKEFKCELCGREFIRRYQYNAHLLKCQTKNNNSADIKS